MNVHYRIVGTLVFVYNWISVQANNQIVAMLSGLFKEIQMANVEQIKCSCNVNLLQMENVTFN